MVVRLTTTRQKSCACKTGEVHLHPGDELDELASMDTSKTGHISNRPSDDQPSEATATHFKTQSLFLTATPLLHA